MGVRIGRDHSGGMSVSLENDLLTLRYSYILPSDAESPECSETMIRDCRLKAFPDENIAAAYGLDGAAHRGLCRAADGIDGGNGYETVRLTWDPVPTRVKNHPGPAISDIILWKDRPWLKIVHRNFCFAHICDIGSPGGLAAGVVEADCGGAYAIHGFEKEQPPLYEDCLYWIEDGCMGCTGAHAHPDGFAVDPGPLSYKGWFVMGVYNRQNGRGYGRLLPVAQTLVVKLLWNKGFELFPRHEEVVSYLYFFEGAAAGALKAGTALVDGIG